MVFSNRLVGNKAPEWTMEGFFDGEMKKYSLADYKGKWLVIFFYPLDFTFVCPTEIKGFSAHADKFKEKVCELVGASIDSVHSHKAWVERDFTDGLNLPLLSDITKDVAYEYGALLEDEGISLRGTYVIDPEGIVRYMVVSGNNVGRSVDETLRVVEALQNGGLCPVDWKPGEDTL